MNFNHLVFSLLSLFWGFSFVAIKVIVENIPPFLGATLRIAFAIPFLLIIFWMTGKSNQVPRKLLPNMWFNGLFLQGLPYAFLFWGERFISPGLTAILQGTLPIFTLLLSIIFLKGIETIDVTKILGLLVSFLGIFCIFYPKIDLNQLSNSFLGTAAITLMSISYAIGTIKNRKLLAVNPKINLYGNLFHNHISALVFLFAISLMKEGWPNLTPLLNNSSVVYGILYLSLFSNAIAWIIFFYLMEKWGAVRTVSVAYIVPLVGLIADFVVFRNLPLVYEMGGAALILLGVIIVQTKSKFGVNFGKLGMYNLKKRIIAQYKFKT